MERTDSILRDAIYADISATVDTDVSRIAVVFAVVFAGVLQVT